MAPNPPLSRSFVYLENGSFFVSSKSICTLLNCAHQDLLSHIRAYVNERPENAGLFRSAETGVAITRAGFEAVLDTWNAEPDQLQIQRIRSEFIQFEAVGGRGFVSLSVLASEITSSLPNKTKLEQMS